MDNLPPIYFYLPDADWRDDMPNAPDIYWEEFGRGIYCWTLQTYLYLKADGFPCELVKRIPDEGIVIAHRDSFSYELRPTKKVLMVCIKPDRNPHPYAQLHVVQNPQDAKNLKNSYFIPLWRQPGLIPRDSTRGDCFKNIAYFGINSNLASELKTSSWSKQLADLGLNWQIIPQNRWYDYNNIDVIVAVRSFQQQDYTNKPATKLYNAWLAGVPAILGEESAFQAERKSQLDYIEVNCLNEIIKALKSLQEQPELYRAMIDNGQIRTQEILPEKVRKKWTAFFVNTAAPAYYNWCNLSDWERKAFLQTCYLKIKFNALKQHLGLKSSF
ncbi:MAG: Glycosyltransferase involved in cell wall bisynthesis [Chloroflexi bacterium AL-N10]|nr:Glycosyltransferase involved in cell wall bisynthesis [Chloroflexi bacterium AL-N10]